MKGNGFIWYDAETLGNGTLSCVLDYASAGAPETNWQRARGGLVFNANSGSESNPMAGHANGSDIHPCNIKMLPLIAY